MALALQDETLQDDTLPDDTLPDDTSDDGVGAPTRATASMSVTGVPEYFTVARLGLRQLSKAVALCLGTAWVTVLVATVALVGAAQVSGQISTLEGVLAALAGLDSVEVSAQALVMIVMTLVTFAFVVILLASVTLAFIYNRVAAVAGGIHVQIAGPLVTDAGPS